jgi:hypothetical protein
MYAYASSTPTQTDMLAHAMVMQYGMQPCTVSIAISVYVLFLDPLTPFIVPLQSIFNVGAEFISKSI